MDGVVAETAKDVIGAGRGDDRIVASGRSRGGDARRERLARGHCHRSLIAEDVVDAAAGPDHVGSAIPDHEVHSASADDLIVG